MKKFSLILAFLFLVLLAGCDQIPQGLDTPSNVSISEGIVTWDLVTDATSYIVIVGSTEYPVTTNTFDLNTLNLSAGTYAVSVVAKKDTLLSTPSTTINFVVEDESITLDAPVVSINAGVISWSPITGATNYVVTVNGITYNVTGTSYNLTGLSLPEGNYSITVRATDGTNNSSSSNSVSFEVTTVVTGLKLSLLQLVNPIYEENMTSSDFGGDIYAYETYQQVNQFVDMYIAESALNGLTNTEALALAAAIFNIPNEMQTVQSTTALAVIIDDLLATGLSPDLISSLVVSVAINLLPNEIANVSAYLNEANNDLEDQQTYMNSILNTDEALALKQTLLSIAAPDVDAWVEDIFNGNFEDVSFIYKAYSMAYEIVNYGSADVYMYVYGPDDINTFMIYDILMSAEQNNPAFLAQLANYDYALFEPLFAYDTANWDLQYLKQEVNSLQSQYQVLQGLQMLVEQNTIDVEDAINQVITYVFTVYEAIPADFLLSVDSLITSGEFSPTEIFILKDEVVQILIDTLPTEDVYQTFLNTMVGLVGAFTAQDVSQLLADTGDFATLMHHSDLLALNLLLQFSETDFNVLQALIMAVEPSPEYLYMVTTPSPDPAAVIDLMLWVATYVTNFIDSQSVLVSEINALPLDTMTTDVASFIASIALDQLANQLDENTYLLVEGIVEEAITNMPAYLELANSIESLGLDVIHAFVNTEASLFYYIITLQTTYQPTQSEIINMIYGLLDEVAPYHALLHQTIDQSFIENALLLARIPLLINIANNNIPDVDLDLLYAAVAPDIVTILLNVLSLEEQVFNALDAVNDFEQSITTWNIDIELALVCYGTILLNDLLTLDNIVLIETTLDLVFTGIMRETIVMDLANLNEEMISSMQLQVTDTIEYYITTIGEISQYDFANLTVEQLAVIEQAFAFLFPSAPVYN